MQPNPMTVLKTLQALANCLLSQVHYHRSRSLFINHALLLVAAKAVARVLHLRYTSVTPIPTERKTLK